MEPITINTESSNLTEEQFFQLCTDNREIRFERDKYKNIILMSPTGAFTGSYHFSIAGWLWQWNQKHKLGRCFDSSSGFTLPNGAMRAPDISWIANERWEKIPLTDKKRFAHICPDFIIEVVSESDSLKQQMEKMKEWIENGCRLAWLIDIEEQKVYIYRQNGTSECIGTFNAIVSGEDVLPGFELDLKELINL